ncbi:BT_3987 domain-containing protein [Dysgonomonas macrotermitis]|uniref:Glycosyl hydrolases family 18 n=1 Tax=Dysgonomonas macrotermitis TaxID=1346286 RepID=A0A1M4VU27_9BACT|nr:DUF1735 domain-containing protein [Dysgonomonas macrotermitis]SHE72355.1 Glycosyl hydrolases family 18 [Dysgonomonas macrotermitis]
MKYLNHIKYYLLTMSVLFVASCFTACNDDIDLATNGNYDNIEGIYGTVKNVSGARELSTITIFGNNTGTGQLYFELTEKASDAVKVQLKISKEALEAYNTANGTSYEIYPESQVTFANGGTLNIAAGAQKSETVDITVASNNGVGKTYALPISAEVTVGGVAVSKANQSYIYLIKPYGAIPNSDKGTGIKSILYIEVNDENLLNAGEYMMVGSGKPFFDVVNIFAANINYNSETKRAYVNCNENISYLLQHADEYIRPLQAKGIKVCLTILGNHDEAGVANLSREAAADFARELKSYVDVYGLDGIDFDDEYSKYNSENPSPGFEAPSGSAAANLVYECRKIMPDKIISVYDYTNYLPSGSIEGKEIGTLIDYAYWGAYANWSDRHEKITGMTKKQYGPSSFNLNLSASNGGYNLEDVKAVRKDGYGIQMYYNLKVGYDYSGALNQMAKVLFDDEVEWTGVTYTKNSTSGIKNSPSYSSYLGEWKTTSANSLYYYYPGPWWDWSGSMSTTLKFEQKVAGESYNVYGWYGTENDLPLVINYNSKTGWIEMPLPQKAKDTKTGEEWLYMGRYQYPYSSAYWMNYPEQYVAYSGVLNNDGINIQATPVSGYRLTRTMSAVQLNTAGTEIVAVKGELDKGVVWQPYSLGK